jgi:hypothetical protein
MVAKVVPPDKIGELTEEESQMHSKEVWMD